jgi:hypothetical protein
LEPGRNLAKVFRLSMETDVVGMAVFADKGVEIPLSREVIENIFHEFRLETAEGELTAIMGVATKVCKLQHWVYPS